MTKQLIPGVYCGMKEVKLESLYIISHRHVIII